MNLMNSLDRNFRSFDLFSFYGPEYVCLFKKKELLHVNIIFNHFFLKRFVKHPYIILLKYQGGTYAIYK